MSEENNIPAASQELPVAITEEVEIESVYQMNSKPAEPTSAGQPLVIYIKDASVKSGNIFFTISVKSELTQYVIKETSVTRSHSDFEWLHATLSENPKFSGLIIPACPLKPDFTVNRESIATYTDDEDPESIEYQKMKEELEREYLGFFKKAVACHEVFLLRIAKIIPLRIDPCVIEFLTSAENIKTKQGALTKIKGMFKSVKRNFDEGITVAFTSVNEPDRYFEDKATSVTNHLNTLRNTTTCADSMTYSQKRLSNVLIRLTLFYSHFELIEYSHLQKIISKLATFFDKVRKIESRISTDEDLKLTDTLKFHLANYEACRDMLLRRQKSYIASENSLKALNKAKVKNENISIADDNYQQSLKKFQEISDCAREELEREYADRVADLKKNLTGYCDLQINHLKTLIKETDAMLAATDAEA